MHQFMYGAREILIDYVGIERNNILLGVLQHGVNPEWSLGYNFPSPRHNLRRSPVWVASKKGESFLRENGVRDCKAIGSVWSYMLEVSKKNVSSDRSKPKPKGLLFFPMHFGGGFNNLKQVLVEKTHFYNSNDIEVMFRSLRDTFPKEEITCCVFWSDLFEADWLVAAKRYDIKIVCAGIGTTTPYWLNTPARLEFLFKVKNLIESHEACLTEGFMSPIFYALSLDKPVMVTESPFSAKPVIANRELLWLKEKAPILFREFSNNSLTLNLAEELLGEQDVLSPTNLQKHLKWLKV